MNNGLMIDVAFALVLVLGIVFGAKRGLFRSFMALAAICPGGRIQNLSPYPYRTIDIDMKKDLVKILEGDK